MSKNQSFVELYLNGLKQKGGEMDASAVAFYASLDHIMPLSPSVAQNIINEFIDQHSNLKLIASENFSSMAVQLAQGNLLTDKYAEGYPGHRFYAGCNNVDEIELEAARLACELFGAEHAYVQPHSGSDANLVAYISILLAKVQKPILEKLAQSDPAKVSQKEWLAIREALQSQKLLAMDYYSGGHLTHGYRHNISSLMFDTYYYSVDESTYLLDPDNIRKRIREVKPLILLAGYSAYSRKINFAQLREMADEAGAVFMVDMAHFAGLVAGKVFSGDYDPVAHAHIVTSTTHKTLRGPRGGLVLCKKEFAGWVDKGCPMVLGGPLPHALAAKAVAFKEAMSDEFSAYAHKIVENSGALARACIEEGMEVLTGGTDNHLFLIDVAKSFGLTGRQAESALRSCNITLNRNSLPFDINGPWYTSGLRIGTSAVTTIGMGGDEMKEIAGIIKAVLSHVSPDHTDQGEKSLAKFTLPKSVNEKALTAVGELLEKHPIYPNIDLEILKSKV